MSTTPSTIMSAHREYASRPADERYPSAEAMLEAARTRKLHGGERTYPLGALTVTATGGRVQLSSPKGTADLSHWAFGQLSRVLGAPAPYLRTLPADLAVANLAHGLATVGDRDQEVKLLVQAPNGRPEPLVRAVTSPTYGRLYDADLYAPILDTIVGQDDRWTLPPTWDGVPAGAYSGDQDSFLILVNGGSIVTDPSLRNAISDRGATGNGPADGMYRGLLIRNSEVGAASVVIERILFRYICGNHMLWGAVIDRTYRRRHVGTSVRRDTLREIGQLATSWAHASTVDDDAIIRSLINHDLGATKQDVIAELREMGATEDQALRAWTACEQTETVSPGSYWGAAQGLTRIAQQTQYQSDRFELDQLAALVLARGARVAA